MSERSRDYRPELIDDLLTAKSLASVEGENTEYDRALVEFVCSRHGLDTSLFRGEVARLVLAPNAQGRAS